MPKGASPYLVEIANRTKYPRLHTRDISFETRTRHNFRYGVRSFINQRGDIFVFYNRAWRRALISYDYKGLVVSTGKSYEFLPYLYSIEYGKQFRIHKKHKRFDVPLNLKIAETGEKILEQILRDYLERDTYIIKRLEKSGLKDQPYDLIIKRRGKQSILIDFKGVYKVKLNKQDKEGHLVIDCRHAAELSQMRGIPVLAYSDGYSLLIHRALEEMRERNEKRFRILKERPFYVIAERLPSVYVNFNKVIEAHEEREIEFNPRFVFVRRCQGLKKAGGDYKQKTALLSKLYPCSRGIEDFIGLI